jgi:hypothetical protein
MSNKFHPNFGPVGGPPPSDTSHVTQLPTAGPSSAAVTGHESPALESETAGAVSAQETEQFSECSEYKDDPLGTLRELGIFKSD